uniref:hypothetical protein n=1 Tax=Desulfurobacterium sp. TaxID=2004706 RepID=UPI0026220BDF
LKEYAEKLKSYLRKHLWFARRVVNRDSFYFLSEFKKNLEKIQSLYRGYSKFEMPLLDFLSGENPNVITFHVELPGRVKQGRKEIKFSLEGELLKTTDIINGEENYDLIEQSTRVVVETVEPGKISVKEIPLTAFAKDIVEVFKVFIYALVYDEPLSFAKKVENLISPGRR